MVRQVRKWQSLECGSSVERAGSTQCSDGQVVEVLLEYQGFDLVLGGEA
jgi:hypothetical protein